MNSRIGWGVVCFAISCTAVAEEAIQRDFGISFGSDSSLTFRKALSENTAVFAGVGLWSGKTEMQSTYNGVVINDSYSSTGYSITAGVRHYFGKDKLSNFVQMSLTDTIVKYSDGSAAPVFWQAGIGYGVEYFIDTRLSVEGMARANMSYQKYDSSTYRTVSKSIQTPTVTVALNYYW